jgi:amino acid transporter
MNMDRTEPRPGTWRLVALGIGSMVGAGIFALLGEAAIIAGPAVWMSFLLAGVIAFLTGHSFVQLAVRYPSRGGVVEYLTQAYGVGVFSGSCSLLFYISQLIGMAMISLAFGKFARQLLTIDSNPQFWEPFLGCILILGLSGLHLVGSTLLSQAQRTIVILNLGLLTAFALALGTHVETAPSVDDTSIGMMAVLGSLSLTFMAFTGFAVISNAADRVQNPARVLPRAMYLSIGLVLTLYVGLAYALAAVVEPDALRSEGANLLVFAAQSFLGDIGYYALLITAVAGTVSCLNGGLFGAANITFALAEKGQLPHRFKREIKATTRGLTFTAAAAILLVCFFDLSSVASLGAATSLMVYMLVNFAALRLLKPQGIRFLIICSSVAACILAILVWSVHTVQTSPSSLLVFAGFLVTSFAFEVLLQRIARRRIRPTVDVSTIAAVNNSVPKVSV